MSTADIEHSPEPNVRWFPWPAAAAQPGEKAFFKIGSMDRPEYQEALVRARRKHGAKGSKPRPANLLRSWPKSARAWALRGDAQRHLKRYGILSRCKGVLRTEYEIKLGNGYRTWQLGENVATAATRPALTIL